ncbi:hypothetical protein [Jiangella anatolica]|uniref:Polyketide cyclase n=1 Tax=Jiangella anatolica TaxID=2670374 RepID=A0A2W2CEH2_9ACTN|nr:hypothetical protein [Jiangella anatolica]PZF86639.1 hypothetical protein C1I92_00200 [Jiangella anatolica]
MEYRRLDDKEFDSHYLYVEREIHHPVKAVWPHVLAIGSWMNAHELRTLDGAPGEVGFFERVLPRDLAPDVPPPHYHLYGIAHVVPYKYVALEVFPERGGSYGKARPKIDLDGIHLVDVGASTKLIFCMIDIQLGEGPPGSYEQRESELDGVRGMLEDYFDTLEALVEESAGRGR